VPRQRTHSGQEDLLSISDRAACDTILQGQQQQTNRSTDTRAGVSTAAVTVPSDANQPADGRPRVFNFGLLKTGTTSLHEALKALGIASCKWQPDFRYVTLNETAAFVRSPLHGSTRLHHVLADRRCSAVSDNPWWALYRTLMTAYPHAKLILTRWSGGCGSAGWMSHIRGLFAFGHRAPSWNYETLRTWNRCLYGSTGTITNATWPGFARRCEEHERGVIATARALGRPLLVLPVEWSDAQKWSALQSFLGPLSARQPQPPISGSSPGAGNAKGSLAFPHVRTATARVRGTLTEELGKGTD